MSIWRHGDPITEESLVRAARNQQNCPFCDMALEFLRTGDEGSRLARKTGPMFHQMELDYQVTNYWACSLCGWWKGNRIHYVAEDGFTLEMESAASAVLKSLDLSDISLPIDAVRTYLVANYESRKEMHPRMFEMVVGSVFRDHGYITETTAYSNDGGIDVILRGQDAQQVGVQVKRYGKSIQVEQIRSFAGALLLSDYTKGIFVTTSKFQRGAQKVADNAALRGIQIELIDAPRFLSVLKVAQRNMYKAKHELESEISRDAFIQISSRSRMNK
jgi:restriction system protein